MDAGPLWASVTFPLRAATKSSVYRGEVADAAVQAVLASVERIEARESGADSGWDSGPTRIDPRDPAVRGWARPVCRPSDRAIDWQSDSTETVLRKIRSADGSPGVLDTLFDCAVRLYDAHRADGVSGRAGDVVARCGDALARATSDGAVWIGHVREERLTALKLPTASVFPAQSARVAVRGRLRADSLRGGGRSRAAALRVL